MIDAHCHLQSERITNPGALIERARQAGVTAFLLAGVDPLDWRRQADLIADWPCCYASYGLHPQRIRELDARDCDSMLDQLYSAARGETWPPPIAIGEIGLDRLTKTTRTSFATQELVFRKQLALARDLDLPVVLHVVRAHGRTLEILANDGIPEAGGMMHSYSGSAELVDAYIAAGLSISFSGAVAFDRAQRLHAAVARVPSEHLLVETDSPDQTPPPHHPNPNEPAYLPLIIQTVAGIRGQTEARIARQTSENARRIFRLESGP